MSRKKLFRSFYSGLAVLEIYLEMKVCGGSLCRQKKTSGGQTTAAGFSF